MKLQYSFFHIDKMADLPPKRTSALGFHGCSVRGVHQYTAACNCSTAPRAQLHQCLVSANVYFQDEPVSKRAGLCMAARAETTRTQRGLETSGVTKTNKNKSTHHSGHIVPSRANLEFVVSIYRGFQAEHIGAFRPWRASATQLGSPRAV